MTAKDLGNKYNCIKCETKFYDMKKPDPICPKCGADQREAPVAKPAESRRNRLAAMTKVVEPLAPEPAEETEILEEEEFEDEEIAEEEEP